MRYFGVFLAISTLFSYLRHLFVVENQIQDMKPIQRKLKQIPHLRLDISLPLEISLPPVNKTDR